MSTPLNNMVEKIIDISTGEETVRPYTDEEIAKVIATQEQIAIEQTKRNEERTAKDAARQVVLDKLGLSADEVAALLN